MFCMNIAAINFQFLFSVWLTRYSLIGFKIPTHSGAHEARDDCLVPIHSFFPPI